MSQIQRIIELINKLDSTELVEALNACNIKTFDLMTKYPELGDKSLMGFALPLNKLGPLLKSDIGGEIPDEQIPILAKFLISRSGQFVDVFSAPRMVDKKYPLDKALLEHVLAALEKEILLLPEYLKHLDGTPLDINAKVMVDNKNMPLIAIAASRNCLPEFFQHADGMFRADMPMELMNGQVVSPILLALEQNCLQELLAHTDVVIGPTTVLVNGTIGTKDLTSENIIVAAMRYNQLQQLSAYQKFSVDRIKLDEGTAHLALFYGLQNKNIAAIELFLDKFAGGLYINPNSKLVFANHDSLITIAAKLGVLDEFVQLLQNRNLIAPGDPAIDLGQVFSDLILAEGTRLELDSEGEIIENHRVQETMLIEKLDPAQAFQTLLPLAKNGQVYAEVKPSLVEKFIGILGAIEALKDIRYTLELMGPAIPKAGGVVERKVLLKHEDTISSDKFQGVVKFCTDVMADPQSRTLFEVDKKIGPEVTIDDCMFRFEPVVVAMGDDGAAKAE